MLVERAGSDNNCRISSTDSSSNDIASIGFKCGENGDAGGDENMEEPALRCKPRVRFSEPSEIPVEVKVEITVLELRGVALDQANNAEESLNNEAFCFDGLRACISAPSSTSNISTHFPSQPFQISSNHLGHREAIASWKNSHDTLSNEECHLSLNLTQAIGIDGMDSENAAYMLNIISLPVTLIHDGKMIPFGIAQMVISNLSQIPSEAVLSVFGTGINAKGRTVATLFHTKKDSNLLLHPNEGHYAAEVKRVDIKILQPKSLRKSFASKVKQVRSLPHRISNVSASSCKVKYPEDGACTLRIRIDVQKVLS